MAGRAISHRRRAIVNTDAKNEVDDQFAIVHALLSPSLDIRGLVAAHFGNRRTRSSMEGSRAEIDLLLRLMELGGTVRVEDGAPYALPDMVSPVPSPGADLVIIEEAMGDVPEPLYVALLGPLTDMASGLLLEPRIAERDVTVIWIGGNGYDGRGSLPVRPEFNLSNDIGAANVVFASAVKGWQVPVPAYRVTAIGYVELDAKVAPYDEIGEYLVRQLVEWNEQHSGSIEFRALGDSPAIGLMLHPDCGTWVERPVPNFRYDESYDFSFGNRAVRTYDSIDARFIFEDSFAKLQAFARR